MADCFEIDLDLIQSKLRIARPALHHQRSACRDTGQERIRRCDLLTRTTQMGWLIDHQLVVSDLVQGAPGRLRC